MNPPGLVGLLDLTSKVVNININDVRQTGFQVLPNLTSQLLSGHDLAGMSHQKFEQFEFSRRQLDLPPSNDQTTVDAIQFQTGDVEHESRVGLIRRASQAGSDTCHKLLPGERFGQIVISASVQSSHPILDGSTGREH